MIREIYANGITAFNKTYLGSLLLVVAWVPRDSGLPRI